MRSATATYKRLDAATASANGSAPSAFSSAKIADHAADDGREAGQQVQDQRAPPRRRSSAAPRRCRLPGDFVGHDGQRRHDAEVHVGQEGRGDQYAVEHVVQGITYQHQRAARSCGRPC